MTYPFFIAFSNSRPYVSFNIFSKSSIKHFRSFVQAFKDFSFFSSPFPPQKKGTEQFFILFVQFARNTLNVSCQIILFIHPMNLSTLQLFCFLCESVNFFFRLVNVIIVLHQQCDQVFQCFHSFVAGSCRRHEHEIHLFDHSTYFVHLFPGRVLVSLTIISS